MKQAHLIAWAVLFSSSHALAETNTFKAKVIGSESQLSIEGVRSSASAPSNPVNKLEGQLEAETAIGGGASLEFQLSDPMRLGLGASYLQFEGDEGGLGYSDFVLESYGTLDFVDQDVLALYGKAGLSFHQLALESVDSGRTRLEFDDATLLNYDLGVGARFRLNRQSTFSLEYNYSNTLSTGDVDVSSSTLGLTTPVEDKLQGVSMNKNELVASLGFSF